MINSRGYPSCASLKFATKKKIPRSSNKLTPIGLSDCARPTTLERMIDHPRLHQIFIHVILVTWANRLLFICCTLAMLFLSLPWFPPFQPLGCCRQCSWSCSVLCRLLLARYTAWVISLLLSSRIVLCALLLVVCTGGAYQCCCKSEIQRTIPQPYGPALP